jgi:hypothetical protein
MDLNDKVFVIKDKEYLVITSVNYNNRTYVYLVNKMDERDAMFREVVNENNECFLQEIDKDLFNERIFSLFIKEFNN